MKLLNKIRPVPDWESEDPAIRAGAVRGIDADLQEVLAKVAQYDENSKVRREAVARLEDVEVLAAIAAGDLDQTVREQAKDVIRELAINAEEIAVAEQALESLSADRELVAVARSAKLELVRRVALDRVNGEQALGTIARVTSDTKIARAALLRLEDQSEIEAVVIKAVDKGIADEAFERLARSKPSLSVYQSIARRTRHKTVARRARLAFSTLNNGTKLLARNQAEAERFCQQLETLAAANDDFERSHERFGQLLSQWSELDAPVDGSLLQRFSEARSQAEAYLCELESKEAYSRQVVRDHEAALAVRHELCLRVERFSPDGTQADVQRLREEWIALPALSIELSLSGEVSTLERRFEAGVVALEHNLEIRTKRLASVVELQRVVNEMEQVFDAEVLETEKSTRWTVADKLWQGLIGSVDRNQTEKDLVLDDLIKDVKRRKDAVDARWKAYRTEKSVEQEREARDILTKLRERCDFVEKLVDSDDLNLSKAERELRTTSAALKDLNALPSRFRGHSVVRRLKNSKVLLTGKVRELRDFSDWQRWANLAVQENLCQEIEALTDLADDAVVVARTDDILARWRQVVDVPKAPGKVLWSRFKTAHDVIYPRYLAHREVQSAEREQNLEQRLRLVEEAERLALSTDWLRTVQRITELQAEWKLAGQVPRSTQRVLWKRFRSATSTFFSRRKADLNERRREWMENLKLKEQLCARVETLAEQDDLKALKQEVQRARLEWKKIGPVRRNLSDALWKRFRQACEILLERTDAVEREAVSELLAEREGLCAELEALLPTHEGQPPREGLADIVRELRQRWRKVSELPQPQRARLAARFGRTTARVIHSFPQAFSGTSLDPVRQLKRLKQMCRRVEALVDKELVDDHDASPAQVLAAKLQDALANNLMGNRIDQAANRRAAVDEMRQLESEHRRFGPLLGNEARSLSERFQRACERLASQSKL